MDNVDKIKQKAEKAADYTAHPEHETNREARKRQPFMPILGSILAALILFALATIYFGWA